MTETVIFSLMGNTLEPEGYHFDGTVKVFHMWANILRKFGVDAYVAAPSEKQSAWLVNPAPLITWDGVLSLAASDPPIKIVTVGPRDPRVWEELGPALDQAVYLFVDRMPTGHVRDLLYIGFRNVKNLVVANRHIQAQIMGQYRIKPNVITIPTDCTIFYPDPEKRERHKIGFFHSPQAPAQMVVLGNALHRSGIRHEFVMMRLTEVEVADKLRTCTLFVGLNTDHALWGSGYSITHQEAMACGCIPVLFDNIGNMEYAINGHNAIIVPRDDIQYMATVLTYFQVQQQSWEQVGLIAAQWVRQLKSVPMGVKDLLQWLEIEDIQ
jgi:glycosyltransferase involved in cell wall biosynthesis